MLPSIVLAASIPTLVLGQNSCSALTARAAPADEPVSSLVEPPTPINKTTLAHVRSNLLKNATKSWELGTASQALIEFSWPAISVFNETAFPPIPANRTSAFNVSDVLDIADRTVEQKSAEIATLVKDGAAGDPPSLGIAVLYANVSYPNETYSDAAESQLHHLLYNVPRYKNGAISHRESEAQLWADFIAMAPPFIAYYGALHENRTLLEIAYNQTKLYREVLRDEETGLWKHIIGGSWEDDSLWATGNAWAAWGMLRVHQTLNHSTFGQELIAEQNDLLDWTTEIVLSAWEDRNDEGILYNTLGCDGPEDDFGDTASTALLTGVTYRLAQVYADATKKFIESSNSTTDIPETDPPISESAVVSATSAASSPIPSIPSGASLSVKSPLDFPANWSDSYTTANLTQPLSLNLTLNALLEGALEAADEAYTTISEEYLTTTGWLQGAVDPLSFTCQLADEYGSPEGQAFVLIMEGARRDWNAWVNPPSLNETESEFPTNETVAIVANARIGIVQVS